MASKCRSNSALTASERRYVEEIAQRQFKYSKIISDNASVFLSDPAGTDAAFKAVSARPDFATRENGLKWIPETPKQQEEHMNKLIAMCEELKECHNLEDYVMKSSIAFSIITCITFVELPKQPDRVQTAISIRSTELDRLYCAQIGPDIQQVNADERSADPRMKIAPPLPPLVIPDVGRLRSDPVSGQRLAAFKSNPFDLEGHIFILKDGPRAKKDGLQDIDEDVIMYAVIGVHGSLRAATLSFDVQYSGVDWADNISAKEMWSMLKQSEMQRI